MKQLFEIIKEKADLYARKAELEKEHKSTIDDMQEKIAELNRLEVLAISDVQIDQVQIAEEILYTRGDPSKNCEGRTLTTAAALDIANDCKHLRGRYFGNKTYSGFYQQCDCEYGMGPKHGTIVEEVGLKREYRDKDLTDEQKNACIHYLRNYSKIKQAITA